MRDLAVEDRPQLADIVTVGTVNRRPAPAYTFLLIVKCHAALPQRREESCFTPLLEILVHRTVGSIALRQRLPLDTGAQHKHDALKYTSRIKPSN